MTVTELLNRLDRLRKTGEGWSALCPAHADTNPSLSVGMGDGGQILLRCFVGCPTDRAGLRAFYCPSCYSPKGQEPLAKICDPTGSFELVNRTMPVKVVAPRRRIAVWYGG